MVFRIHSLLSELSKNHRTILKTKQLHAIISKTNLSLDPFFATKLIRFYALNNDLRSARKLFDETPQRSVFLWNSIIRAYAQTHNFDAALSLFEKMFASETKPDSFTYACVTRACYENFDLDGMRIVHTRLILSGLGLDSVCGSALVTGYSKLCLVDEASKVFYRMPEKDLVLWNAMVSGYVNRGFVNKGLELFSWMRHIGEKPDGYTFVAVISGLMDPGLLLAGQGIHGLCLKTGFDCTVHVGSSLMSLYSRFKSMDSANIVFSSMLQPDLVAWSSLITGNSQCEDYDKAFFYFRKLNMTKKGKTADPVLISAVLSASAQSANAKFGNEIHCYVVRHGFESNIAVSSALIDMYSKCGFVNSANRVFDITQERSVISYNSLILGLGLNGLPLRAFKMFIEMLAVDLKPDDATFSALLSAFCHAGLVDDGWEVLRRMKSEFSIQPKTEHYVHMVKLLGMAGKMEEAYNLISSLPEPVDSGILGALLSCCEVHGNSELAEAISLQLLENEPRKSAYRIMLSNIYAVHGRWDAVKTVRDGITGRKLPGLSWIESGNT